MYYIYIYTYICFEFTSRLREYKCFFIYFVTSAHWLVFIQIGTLLSGFRLLFVTVHTNKNTKPATPKAILAPKPLCRATSRYVINFSLHLLSAWYLRLEDNNRGKYFTYRLSLMLERCVISLHGWRVSAFYAPRLCCGTSRHVLSCVAHVLESNRPLRWGRVFERTTASRVPVTILLYPSLMCHLDECCGVMTMEQRHTPLSLSNYPLSVCCLAAMVVWRRRACGEDDTDAEKLTIRTDSEENLNGA